MGRSEAQQTKNALFPSKQLRMPCLGLEPDLLFTWTVNHGKAHSGQHLGALKVGKVPIFHLPPFRTAHPNKLPQDCHFVFMMSLAVEFEI